MYKRANNKISIAQIYPIKYICGFINRQPNILLIMSIKQETKNQKLKKLKDSEPQNRFLSPEKQDYDLAKTPLLRDLSPFSPIYPTIKKSYDNYTSNCDLAIIETPLVQAPPKSIIQEVQGYYNQFSKLLVWQQEQYQNKSNERSGQLSQNSEQKQEIQNSSQKQNENISGNKFSDQQVRLQSQVQQKAGEKTKQKKIHKKNQQKRIKISQSEITKKVSCNCKKTKCLKLYCDCFHENQVCGSSCNCVGCHNTDQYRQERYNSMLTLIQRNPEAFRPRLQPQQHAKGCNCKKSGCLKKYCQCYQAGLICGKNCKCEQCKNCRQVGKQKQQKEQQQGKR